MLKHYLKVATRNLLKNKIQSAISILGLAVGFACIAMAAIWIQYETSYDSIHPNAKNIYRILKASKKKQNDCAPALTMPYIDKIAQEYPEVDKICAFNYLSFVSIQKDEGRTVACYGTQPSFFDVFSIQFIAGNKETAFAQPNSVVLSESLATELFESAEGAMGKMLKAKNRDNTQSPDYIVTGVSKDIKHTNLKLDAIIPFSPAEQKLATTPVFNDVYENIFECYVLLKNNINKNDFYNKLKVDENEWYYNTAVPITQLHYKYNYGQARVIPFNFNYILILVSISFLLFICALFNYISVFISFTYTRLRDLGLRKSMGSSTIQLFLLLVTEFVFTLLLAFLLGACLIEILRPTLENATQITIQTSQIFAITGFIAIVGAIFSLLLISYPTWRICNVVIKRNMTGKRGMGQQRIQKMLIVVQLIISVFLLFVTSVMYYQSHFVSNKNLGMSIKNVICINPDKADYKIYENKSNIILNQLIQNTNIQSAIIQSTDFFSEGGNRNAPSRVLSWEGKNPDDEYTLTRLYVSLDFVNFFGSKIKEGRFFSKDFASDNEKILVNETLAAIIGNPIGKTITMGETAYEIIGVMEDIQDRSLKNKLQPTLIFLASNDVPICVRYAEGKANEVTEQISNVLKNNGIGMYKIQFMEETFKEFTKADRVMMQFVSVVAIVCLIISTFGIYSLTLYSMARRRREVAIRKVMGAEVGDIIRMFFKEYLWLVVIACIIALPLAYYSADKWLQEYANRINIKWWIIVAIIVIITLVVVFTVLRQIIKTANANPADVVKYE